MFTNFYLPQHRKSKWDSVHKFGSNPNIVASNETIWTPGGLYPWNALATAQTLYVQSSDNGDAGNVTIYGLDSNYNELTETVAISGGATTTTTNTFLRVFRMRYVDTTGNAGDITARTVSNAGTIVAQIDVGKGQTLMAVYTIPAGKTAYLLCYSFGTGKNAEIHLEMYMREVGAAFQIKTIGSVYSGSFTKHFEVPLYIPAKTDIDMRAYSTVTPISCNGTFDLILLD